MAATKDILTGFATYLAGAGIGLTFNPNGIYTTGQTGIFLMHMPDTPDRVVVLTLVDTGDSVSLPFGQKMLQVRGRGNRNDPTDVGEVLDPIFDILHAATNLTVGGHVVTQIYRQVSAPMGEDQNVRTERADQYYMDIDATPTGLRPAGGSW